MVVTAMQLRARFTLDGEAVVCGPDGVAVCGLATEEIARARILNNCKQQKVACYVLARRSLECAASLLSH
jgi:hypothetical protein